MIDNFFDKCSNFKMNYFLLIFLFALNFSANAEYEMLKDIPYGDHYRNVLDVAFDPTQGQRETIIYFHGGGFEAGDKRVFWNKKKVINKFKRLGVTLISVNYRFLEHAPIQDIMKDIKRSIQFVRYNAADLGVDKSNIYIYGASAGGGAAQYLAFHDDMKNVNSYDPVEWESTRVSAVGIIDSQYSYDLPKWKNLLGIDIKTYKPYYYSDFYGLSHEGQINTPQMLETRKDLHHIAHVNKGDPPTLIISTVKNKKIESLGEYLHHPLHGLALTNKCLQNGVSVTSLIGSEYRSIGADHLAFAFF